MLGGAIAVGMGHNNAIAAAPSAPSSVVATSTVSGTQKYPTATITWSLGADGGSTITNHQWSIDGSTWNNFSEGLVTGTSGNISQSSKLNFGTNYTIQVRAINSAGNGTAASTVSSITFSPGACSPTISVDGKSFIFTTVGVCEWSLPTEVKSIVNFDIRGAQGGGSVELKGSALGAGGGLGARIRGVINLTTFSSIYVFVGSKGMENTKAARPLGTNFGGFNGGGDGKGGTQNPNYPFGYTTAGGGGGSTDIRTSLVTISSASDSRLLVAGGGGGASRIGNGGNSGWGGAGGPSTQTSAFIAAGTKGQDGTYSGDWTGGAGGSTLDCGALYGLGATPTLTNAPLGFAAGGGGYCGGEVGSDNGQGWGAPGGGGSSFASSTYVSSLPTHNGGAQCGDGSLVVSVSGFSSAQVPAPDTTNCGGKDPEAPTLSGSKLSGKVSLTWSDSNSGITDYVVEYSTSSTFDSAVTVFPDGESATKSVTVTGLTNGTSYYFRVKAINDYGISTYSSITPALVPSLPSTPATPDLDSASDLGSSSTDNRTADDTPTFSIASGLTSGATVTLTATPAAGSASTCTFTAAGSSGSCTFTSLANGTYSVTAFQAISGDSSATSAALANVVINKVNISTPATPDLASSSDSGSSSTDNITNDSTPTINVSGAFTGTATVTATKAGSASVSCTISSNTCTLGTLTDGDWSITVTDSDGDGNSSATSQALSIKVDTTRPTATVPTQYINANYTVAHMLTNSIQIQSNEVGTIYLVLADGTSVTSSTTLENYVNYVYSGGSTNGNNKGTKATIATANTLTEISTSNLTNEGNTTYYVAYAVDIAGNISLLPADSQKVKVANPSAPTATSTSAPTGTATVRGTLTNAVTFSGLPTPTLTYQWKRCTSSTDTGTCTDILGATSSTYVVSDYDCNYTNQCGYFIRSYVTATNASGSTSQTSTATSQVQVTGASQPLNVAATRLSSTSARITWDRPVSLGGYTNGCGNNCYYRLEASYQSPENWATFTDNVLHTNTSSFSTDVTNLVAGREYKFRVSYTNSAGGGDNSTASNLISTADLPGAPTSVSSTKTGSTTATVAFTEPASNGGSAITGYTVTSSPAGATCSASPSTNTTYSCTGLSPGTSYTFTVVANNAIGGSTSSSPSASITTDATVPGAPTSLSVTAGNGQAIISFTAPVSDGGAAITNFKYSLDGTNYTALSPADVTSPITIPGLTNGTAYTITLKAVNSAGDSVASSAVSVTPATSPNAPTIGTATATLARIAEEERLAELARIAEEKLAADKAAAAAFADKTKVDAAAALVAAQTAIAKAKATEAAKVIVDASASDAAALAKAVADAQAAATKAAADAASAIKSAPTVAAKAATTASANKAAAAIATQVKTAAAAAMKDVATTIVTPKTPEIAIGTPNSQSAASQNAAKANAAAAAAKTAAIKIMTAALAKANEAKAAAILAQKAASDAAEAVVNEQKVAATAAAEAKVAADNFAVSTAEQIVATAAAKVAAENLVILLQEKVVLAEKAAVAPDESSRSEIQKSIDQLSAKIEEALRVVADTSAKAELATASQAEASKVAETTMALADAQLAKAMQVRSEAAVKTTAASRAAAVAAVESKVAAAAKAEAAKVPATAAISTKPGVSTGKNSTRATIFGLKPGQKVKVTVNVKPKP